MKLLPSRRVLCTPYNHAPCHFMQSHIRKVYACLAVTCHLHFGPDFRCPATPLLISSLSLSLLLLLLLYYWSLLYSAIIRSRADSLRSHVILHSEWIAFIARSWISTEVVYLQRWHSWCHMKLLPSRRVLCLPCNHAPCHFMQSQIRKVNVHLALTCHLHFWQKDSGNISSCTSSLKGVLLEGSGS